MSSHFKRASKRGNLKHLESKLNNRLNRKNIRITNQGKAQITAFVYLLISYKHSTHTGIIVAVQHQVI